MSTIPAAGPYKGVISTVSQLIREGNQKKYVVLNSEGYSLSEDKRELRVSLRILASHVIRSLSFELVDSEKLEEVSNALEYLSKRSIESGNKRGMFCRAVSHLVQEYTNSFIFRDLAFINNQGAAITCHVLHQLSNHIRDVAIRMRENRDESFVLFMTALSCQHQEMRAVSTLDTALFNHLATEQHIENARKNLHIENGQQLLSKIQTLDLSDFKGELTEEIVQIIQSMTSLKTLKLSGTEIRRLILSHPSLLELQVEDCKLVDLDVSGCNELLVLNASRNSLKTVVGITEKCKILILDGNEISSNRCLRSAKGLEILSIKNSRGRLEVLNLSQMKKLRELDVSSNRGLKTVVVHESVSKESMRMAEEASFERLGSRVRGSRKKLTNG